MNWSDDRFEALKELVGQGLSAREIAAAIGGVSRNAVISKVHRCGLAFSNAPGMENKKPQKPQRSAHRYRSATPQIMTDKKLRPPRVTELAPESPAQAVTLAELTKDHCRWPIGTADRMLYCGAPVLIGEPYCARHYAMAHP